MPENAARKIRMAPEPVNGLVRAKILSPLVPISPLFAPDRICVRSTREENGGRYWD